MTVPIGCACGVAEGSGTARCNACPVLTSTAASGDPVPSRVGVGRPAPVVPPTARHSRWAKSQTSFGPVGRVVATVALLVPLVVLLATVVTGIGIVGAGIYGFVIVPWGLKDIWKKTRIPDGVAPPR